MNEISNPLTLKQNNFCDKYIETGNASEAYRQVYNSGQMKMETIHRKAAELMRNGKVTARIKELQQKIQDKRAITLDKQVEKYLELIATAESEISDAFQKVNAITRIMARLDKISGLEDRKDKGNGKEIKMYCLYPEDINA